MTAGLANSNTAKNVSPQTQARQEIAEPEAPSGNRGAADAERSRSRTVEQPDQERKREKQHRPGVDRRKRQDRDNTRTEGERRAAPAPSEHDRISDAPELHPSTRAYEVTSEGGELPVPRGPPGSAFASGAPPCAVSGSGCPSRRL